jgi:hypothetical protein
VVDRRVVDLHWVGLEQLPSHLHEVDLLHDLAPHAVVGEEELHQQAPLGGLGAVFRRRRLQRSAPRLEPVGARRAQHGGEARHPLRAADCLEIECYFSAGGRPPENAPR